MLPVGVEMGVEEAEAAEVGRGAGEAKGMASESWPVDTERRDAWATFRVPKLALEPFRCLFLLLVGLKTDELSPRSSPPTAAMASWVQGQRIRYGIIVLQLELT